MSTRQFSRLRPRLEPLFVAALLSTLQCTDEVARPPAAENGETPMVPTWTCEDKDGDSYGQGCRMGADCDDTSAEVTVECLCADQKSPGCPCAESGAQAACGTVYSRVGDTVVCGQGVTSCDGDEWGECIINNAVSLPAPASNQSPELRNLTLGAASACTTNPCDPACKTFTDSPENLPLDSSSGVISAASGVTLVSGTSTVIPAISSSGYACTDAAYPPSGGCAHHPCRTGAALSAYCDGTAPVSTPVTIFSDSFSSGNAQGWTLDSNWAIGSAASSTGHSSGNADPASDTTSSSDNQIAGTVLGGNLGGATAFTDGFSNLNQWTESGEGDWTTQTRDSSTGYTTSSGNPVAHSDDCDSGCTITSPVINLSGQTSSTLSFQYYLSSNMEGGEYLRAEVYNGSTWTAVLNRSTESEQDSTWRSASISLASYLVSGFRLRFVTQQSYEDEAVEVDDVSISATPVAVTNYLTSPSFNTSSTSGTVTLSFRRWLNLNSDFTGKLEIYNGSSWVQLYSSNGAAVSDSSWQTVSYDISAYKASNNRIRFSYSGASTSRVSGWNIDDVSVAGTALTGGTSLCIKKVCDARPACCSTSWTIECVDMLDDVCQLECAVNSASSNACIACFNDTTLTTDVDGDGQSPATGDCRECDPGVSGGAYDLPGNNIDENCDGTVDNEVIDCDAALSAGGDAWVHAKALGLCTVASTNTWGVVSASFVRADGITACSDSKQYRVMTSFGSGNLPTAGSSMSVFSSGTARPPGDSSYVAPNGTGYAANTSSTPKYAVPAATGCSAGTAGLDSCGLKLVIRAPTNANSFRYNFNFFTSEYPEWLCTAYNDSYVAYYEGSLNTASNKNISFDSANNPVSVNNGLFSIPGWPPPSVGTHAQLDGTGFDGVCNNSHVGAKYLLSSICGGSTGWLQTSAPVKPGEEITMIFNVWDTGDRKWDSTVLIDNFRWSTSTASVATGTYIPPTPAVVQPATFSEGWFVRDYDMSEESDGYCGDDKVPVWSLWSWNASTPGDSKVEFYVQVATTAGGLATAPRDPLLFTNPPGPTSLAGTAVIARSGSPDTRTGSATVQDALIAADRNQNAPHLRVSARLVPTTDLLQAPVLTSWNLQTSCQTAQ